MKGNGGIMKEDGGPVKRDVGRVGGRVNMDTEIRG
jgi:hypothetical protein